MTGSTAPVMRGAPQDGVDFALEAMMRVRIFALLMLGAVMALIAGVATFSYTRTMETELMSAQAAIQAFGATRQVPVAQSDIPRGTVLKPEDFVPLLLPEEQLPTNILTTLPEFSAAAPVYALSDLRAGALVLQTSLGMPAEGAVAQLLRSPDGRAIVVQPRNLAEFQGRLAVGDLLDLFLTQDTVNGSQTRLIGSALRLMELPQPGGVGAAGGTLLLEVSPRDAARVIGAGPGGNFTILPARAALQSGADQIVVGGPEMAGLPLVGPGLGEGARLLGAGGAAAPGQRCMAVLVRAGNRMEVDVPC